MFMRKVGILSSGVNPKRLRRELKVIRVWHVNHPNNGGVHYQIPLVWDNALNDWVDGEKKWQADWQQRLAWSNRKSRPFTDKRVEDMVYDKSIAQCKRRAYGLNRLITDHI